VQRRSEPLAVSHLPRDNQRPLRPLERRRESGHLARRRQGAAAAHRLARRAEGSRHLARLRDQGLTKRQVHMNRSGARLSDSPRRHAPPEPGRVRQLDRNARVEEPPDRRAVKALLVDRLIRAGALQLGRPVSREHDQRRARVRGFDHRGVKFRGRCTRRAKQHHRLARGLGQADPKERARALVDVHEHLDLWMPLQRHGDRGRARARRDASELDALSRELIHEGCCERLRYIHSIQCE